MSLSDPALHANAHVDTPDHELTDMERFFDNLFNHHLVLPQPPPGEGVEGHDPSHDNPGVTPV